jgi:hypothetical protein
VSIVQGISLKERISFSSTERFMLVRIPSKTWESGTSWNESPLTVKKRFSERLHSRALFELLQKWL